MAVKVKTKRSMDRISNLPDVVLCHILSFLPTKQVVRNSILSTRWKYLFASVTNLDFVYYSLLSHTRKGNENEKPVSNISSFINFVDRVLFSHNASRIDRFNLMCEQEIDCSRVNSWVCAALWRNVQKLNISVYVKKSSMLPGDLFTCKTLVVLKLGFSFFLNVPAKVCLPSLKILHLQSIVFSDDDSIERLFSSCPVLEDLVIQQCNRENICKFNISSHTLKRLTMKYCSGSEFCEYEIVVNAPSLVSLVYDELVADGYSLTNLYSLVEAHVDFGLGSEQKINFGDYDVTEFFKGISNVRSLHLSADAMEVYQLCCYTKPVFHNMTHLTICANEDTLKLGLICLLEGSPKLESLVIEGSELDQCGAYSAYPWEPPKDVPSCLLFHLKEMKFLYLEGSDWEQELKMVGYCLKHAKVLKKLTVHTTSDKEDQLEITKKLLMFPRGSKECQVMIQSHFVLCLFPRVSPFIVY